jgi:hypothetical protein
VRQLLGAVDKTVFNRLLTGVKNIFLSLEKNEPQITILPVPALFVEPNSPNPQIPSGLLLTKIKLFIIIDLNLPPGGGTLYAAQVACVGFHSSPGEGACGPYKPKALLDLK